MYQLNPASLDSDNKSESLYKKPNNKTYKNRKSVNFDTSSDEPIKTKINNVTNILSKLHSSNEEEDEDNSNFQDNLLQQKSKNYENSMSNVNIINNEMNKMNSIDSNNISNTIYNSQANKVYSNLDDSYKSTYNFNNQETTLNSNKELLSKLDYIVHLLEEQHNEKTNHITEELILYLFLGIFIIFVLDSFARSSKYTR